MTLHLATVEQLLEWQAAIVAELARRAAPPAPPVARAPWEMPPPQPTYVQPQAYAPPPPPAPPVAPMMLEAIREWNTGITDLAREVDAWPAWKKRSFIATAGQQRGAVTPTFKTDPALAARFAAVPPRPEGAPPVQGNGKGEGGSVELGPR